MTKTITPDFKNTAVADQVVYREHEVFQYQVNIDNYQHMLNAMKDLPELPSDDMDRVTRGKLDFRNRLRELIVTEQIEQTKAQLVYDALKAQLPVDQSEQLINDAATRRNAKANG